MLLLLLLPLPLPLPLLLPPLPLLLLLLPLRRAVVGCHRSDPTGPGLAPPVSCPGPRVSCLRGRGGGGGGGRLVVG